MKEGVFVISVPDKWEIDEIDLKRQFKHTGYVVLLIQRDDINDIKFEIVK